MRRTFLTGLVAAASVLVTDGNRAAVAVAAAKIVDRTFVCRNTGIGYPDAVRWVTASAAPYDSGFDVAPQMSVGNGNPANPGWGVYVRTGPAGRQNESPTGQVSLPRTGIRRCVSTRLRVPLSSKGLRGGEIQERQLYRCDAPAKVLVRVRAIFKRPVAFRVDPRFRDQEDAKENVTVGYLAVTTLRERKPMVFASVQDAGQKASVFVGRSCALTP